MNRRKRLLKSAAGICLVLMLLFSSVQPVLAEETSENPNVIEVSSEKDLLSLAENCKINSYSMGKTVVLTQDIQVYSPNFKGIPFFNGIFQGNGHTISRLSLTGKGSDQGFFRYLGEQGMVTDLNVSGIVMPSGTQENVGGIAGTNYGTITNCTFVGSVNGENNVGAVAGVNKSTGKIMNCSSRAVVLAVMQTGGIAGENEGLIASCSSESSINVDVLEPTLDLGGIDVGSLNLVKTVTNRTNVGGIAGRNSGIVSQCTNTGTIGYKSSGYNVGGIAGSQNGIIADCENRGEVLGRKDVGGIVGQAQPYLDLVYFQSRLSSTKDQVQQLNRTMQSLSPAVSDTSSDLKYYVTTLVDQYRSLIEGISDDVDSLSSTIETDVNTFKGHADNISNAMRSINDILGSYDKDNLPDLSDAAAREAFLEKIQNDFQLVQQNFDTIIDEMESMSGAFDASGDSAEEFLDSLSEQMHDASRQENIDEMMEALDNHVQNITDIMNQTSGQIDSLMDSVEKAVDTDKEQLDTDGQLIWDVSSLKTAQDTDGVITGCRNYGAVKADLNAGGIAGSMNVDYEMDQETDLDMSSFDPVTRVNASSIAVYCTNYGKIEAKKQQVGGIAGLQELGLIYGCESYGNIAASSGKYVGGIAGNSLAAIQKSYTRSQIEGKDYVGGIAGSGETLQNNVAMAFVIASGEACGAVSGDVTEDGSIVGNYYVNDTYGAVDDISYVGAAEPISYEELMTWPQIPEGFQQVTVTFEQEDGTVLSEKNIARGGTLSPEEYPEVEAEDGCYISWESEKTLDTITENIVVTAVNVPWTKSVAGDIRSADGKDQFLVAGEFYDNTRLYLNEEKGPSDLPEDARLLYAYSWTLACDKEKEQDVLEGHFYTDDQAENAVLYLKKDGKWEKAETSVDGSYLIAEISCGEPFAVVIMPESHMPGYFLIAAAVVFAAGVVIGWRIYRKRSAKRR